MRTWIFSACILLSVSPVFANIERDTPDQLPHSCHLIYASKIEAQQACPLDIPAIPVYDFWQGKLLGWGCDCAPGDGPVKPIR